MSSATETTHPAVRIPELSAPGAAGRVAPACRHCGAALIDDRMRATGFCCAGCTYVFRLVHEHGLAGYYRIKDEITTPADPAVFQPRDYGWLEQAQREAELGLEPDAARAPHLQRKIPELTLDVQGISCAGCVWLIERLFQPQPGARDINVNAQYGTMRLRWVPGKFSAADFARKLQGFGYVVGPAGIAPAEPESRGLVRKIGLCAAFTMNVMLFSLPAYFGMARTYEWAGLFRLLSLAFGTLSLLVGGLYFISRAVRALRERALHIDVPIALGIVGAYLGSLYGWLVGEERFVYFDFVATFILLMLVGRWAQVVAVERNRRRLLSQQPQLQPLTLADGASIAAEAVQAGQVLDVASGQTVPVQARLETAEATFSLASINGEAEPRVFCAGQRVPAGALHVGRGRVRVVALQAWRASLLAQLLAPVERAAARHVFLERVVRGYLIGILGVAAFAGLGWWIATTDVLRTGAVVTAVLVVSCPCAIALAFPLADEMATVALRRRGVFVREEDLWTKLRRVRKLVFDKTGTLTLESPSLRNPDTLAALSPEARAALFTLVRDNAHPISQSLLEHLLAAGPIDSAAAEDDPTANVVMETTGFGVECGPWSLGRGGWRDDEGGSETVFARDGEVLARFRFADEARPGAAGELSALAARGLPTFILSGDDPVKVARLAEQLQVPVARARGGLTPQGKADWLAGSLGADVLMLGDGANDSLAFDQALCRGTPVVHRGVLERKADFYYLGRGIGGVRALFEVDAIRRRTQLAILVFSIAYNVLAVGLAVAGRMNPLVAAALMPINSLLTLAIVTGGMRRAFRV
jgi:Cu2+-exporting ATPase